MNAYEMPTSDDRLVWDTWLSIHYLPAVTVADELGILRSLADAPAAAVELADRLSFDRRTTVAVLRMLKALGFLSLHEGAFQLTDPARLYLLKDSPYYWGYMLGTGQPQHARWRDLLQNGSPRGVPGQEGASSVPEGPGSSPSWASGQVDMERAHRVAAAMQSHSLGAANAMARNGDFDGVRRLLDVGGGSGCFAIALALQHPELRCTVMELSAMCEVAQGYIDAGGATDRVDTVAVDMFREPWPRGYDAMFFSNIFHDWNFETCAWLARRCYDALEPGGRIYLHEMLLDDEGASPITTVSFSMLMLGTQGQQFTLPELRSILEGAGFADVTVRHTHVYYSLVTARKPG
jgi:acetylserotonin N-methyltransferase